jgi:hypothetical protein
VNRSRGLAMDSLLRVEFCDAGSWPLLNKNKGETFARDESEDGGCAPISEFGKGVSVPVTAPPRMRRKRPNGLALRQQHARTRNSPFLLLGRQRMVLDAKVDASSGLVNTKVVLLNGFLFYLTAYARTCGGFAGTAGILTHSPAGGGQFRIPPYSFSCRRVQMYIRPPHSSTIQIRHSPHSSVPHWNFARLTTLPPPSPTPDTLGYGLPYPCAGSHNHELDLMSDGVSLPPVPGPRR